MNSILPCRAKRISQRRGSAARLISVILMVCGLLAGFAGTGRAYEWIDVIQDYTSLNVPMEILRHPLPELQENESQRLFNGMEKEWLRRKRYLAIGDRKVGADILERLYEQMIDLGVIRMRSYSASLLREAMTLSELGDYKEAISRCNSAEKFSPGFPEPHKVLAKVYWKQNKLNLYSVALEWVKVIQSVAGSFDHMVYFLINVSLLLMVIGFAFFGAFYLVQLIRYYPLLTHNIYELLPGEPHKAGMAILTAFFLAVPLIFGWGIYGLCLFWALLFWSYGREKEQFLHLLFLVFMMTVPFWMGGLQRAMEVLHSDWVQAVIHHQDGVSDDASITALTRLTAHSPKDDSLFFMLGTALKKRGEYLEAEARLEKAISLNPYMAIYYNNLGNTFYAGRNIVKAVEMYKQAMLRDPQNAAAYFNLSAAHRDQLMLQESDQEYSKARELDPERISHYVSILGPSYNRILIDETFSNGWLVRRFANQILSMSEIGKKWLPFLWRNSLYLLAPVALLLALFPLHYVLKLLGIACRCVKCGEVYCKRCRTSIRMDSVCSQCVHVFEKQSGVEVKQRIKKIIEIRRYMDKKMETRKALGIFMPGGAYIYSGRMVKGFFLLSFIVVSLVYTFFWDFLCRDPLMVWAASWSSRIWLMIPAVFLYGLSVVRLYRPRE
ncbi:MAG: hypothetical protein AABY87_08840 [bacterium]